VINFKLKNQIHFSIASFNIAAAFGGTLSYLDPPFPAAFTGPV